MSTSSDAASSNPRLSRRRWLTLAAAAGGALAIGAAAAPTLAGASPLTPGSTAMPVRRAPGDQMSMKGSMVTNWFGQSSQGGFFNALKNGYFAEQGLDMKVDQGGPQIIGPTLVAAGQYTFGMTSAEQVLLAREQDVPLVMVFGTFQRNPQGLMYHMSHPVSDFSALNGRKVYVSGAGVFWRVLVAKYGLNDVQQFAYNGQLATFLADEENVFQCYVTSEPVILKSQGKEVGFLINADSGFNPYQNAMACTQKTIDEQPDLVQAYVTASLKGWLDYVNDPKPTLDFIKSEYAKELNLETEPLTFASEKASFLTGEGFDASKFGRMDPQRWSDLYALITEVGVAKGSGDAAAAYNTTFIEQAHASLGM